MSDKDPLSSLDEEGRSRISRMFSGCAEGVGVEHVASVIAGDPSHSVTTSWSLTSGSSPAARPTWRTCCWQTPSATCSTRA